MQHEQEQQPARNARVMLARMHAKETLLEGAVCTCAGGGMHTSCEGRGEGEHAPSETRASSLAELSLALLCPSASVQGSEGQSQAHKVSESDKGEAYLGVQVLYR